MNTKMFGDAIADIMTVIGPETHFYEIQVKAMVLGEDVELTIKKVTE